MKKTLLKTTVFAFTLAISQTIFGQSWTPIFTPGNPTTGSTSLPNTSLSDVSFFDENNGIVSLGYGYFLTTDGGNTWSIEKYFSSSLMSGVDYTGTQEIFMGVGSQIYKSTDGGNNFTLKATPSPSVSITDIKVSGSFGILVDANCKSAYSNDGGDTWTTIANTSLCNNLSRLEIVDIVNASTAFIGGRNGYIFKTTNGGSSWSAINVPNSSENVDGLDFISDQIGFCVKTSTSSTSTIYKTEDGGTTWTNISPSGNAGQLSGIYALDANNLYVGGKGKIYKSTNGGTSYTEDFTNSACTTCTFDIFEKGGNTLFVSVSNGGTQPKVYKKAIGGGSTGISSNIEELKISVLPNPATNQILLSGVDLSSNILMSIFSVDGKLISSEKLSHTTKNIENLNAGIYFVKIVDSKGKTGQAKFIKQ